jgi:hypothetical protein
MGGSDNARFWDLPCFPHILNIAGEHLELPAASQFVRTFASLMSFSCNVRHIWRDVTGVSFEMYSATRWYSLHQTGRHIAENFTRIPEFLDRCAAAQYGRLLHFLLNSMLHYTAAQLMMPTIFYAGDRGTRKIAEAMLTPDRLAQLMVELAVMADVGQCLEYACYKLEGDKALALYAYELWHTATQQLRYVYAVYMNETGV